MDRGVFGKKGEEEGVGSEKIGGFRIQRNEEGVRCRAPPLNTY